MSKSNEQQQRTFTPSNIQQEFLEYTGKQAMAYGGFGGGKCVCADTRIRLADGGTKEIRNMERGDMVLSLDTDTLEIVERPVRAVLETGTKDVFRVSINGLTDVYVSKDHPFYTNTEEWVNVTELVEGDCVASPDYQHESESQFGPENIEVVFRQITEIECVGEAQTYDLEIAGTHNFIGNGVVLHNTRACAEKVYMLNVKYPGNRALIVRRNFSDVRSSTVEQSLLEDVIPESHIPEDGHNKSEHKIEHFTGTRDRNGQPVMSEIYYEGLDSKGSRSQDGLPRRVSGMQFGTIFIDEATETTESDYVQLLGRLRFSGREQAGQKFTVPFRQIMVATNPASPDHYLHDRFLSESTPDNARAFKMRAEDNPGVPQDYVDDMKQNYSGVYYERYVEGEWVGTDAAVYDEFDRRRFVMGLDELRAACGAEWTESPVGSSRLITPPESWSVYRVMDFGYPSPTVCLWLAESPEVDEQGNRVYVVFREAYQPETLIEEMAEQYLEPFSSDVAVEQTFADPAQADSRESLERRGIPTTSANKDVWNGIQEVKSQMATEVEPFGVQDERAESATPPMVPGVLFYEDSLIHEPDAGLADNNKPTRTIEEIAGYEWRDGKDEPVKEDDHGLDCLRYGIYTLQGDTGASYDELEQLATALQEGF